MNKKSHTDSLVRKIWCYMYLSSLCEDVALIKIEMTAGNQASQVA